MNLLALPEKKVLRHPRAVPDDACVRALAPPGRDGPGRLEAAPGGLDAATTVAALAAVLLLLLLGRPLDAAVGAGLVPGIQDQGGRAVGAVGLLGAGARGAGLVAPLARSLAQVIVRSHSTGQAGVSLHLGARGTALAPPRAGLEAVQAGRVASLTRPSPLVFKESQWTRL